MQPVTAGILEQLVFSKPDFDPAGLIVALHDNAPVGFVQAVYRDIDHVGVLLLDLPCFRPPITRNQRQLRREMVCQEIPAPPVRTWWEAHTTGAFERIRFLLTRPSSCTPLADVWFWDIEP